MNRVYRPSTRLGPRPASCFCSAMIREHPGCLHGSGRSLRSARSMRASARGGCGPPASPRPNRQLRFCRVYPAARRPLRGRCGILHILLPNCIACRASVGSILRPADLFGTDAASRIRRRTAQPPHACRIPLTACRPLAEFETATACRKARRHTLPRRKQTAPPEGGAVLLSDRKKSG